MTFKWNFNEKKIPLEFMAIMLEFRSARLKFNCPCCVFNAVANSILVNVFKLNSAWPEVNESSSRTKILTKVTKILRNNLFIPSVPLRWHQTTGNLSNALTYLPPIITAIN